MRRSNENTILAQLRREPGLSGTAIARKTGLAPQTVSVLMRSLEAEGLIVRGKVLRGKRGQPAVPFHLNGAAAYAIGIELGWQQCNFVLIDLAGQITYGMRLAYPYPNPERLITDLCNGVAELKSHIAPRNGRILGISLTVPADLATRAWVLGASEEECRRLGAIDIPADLQKKTGLAVTVYNDGTSALWAETAFGRVTTDMNCGYVFLSTFIGGALHINGQILKGKTGNIGAAMTRREDGTISALHFSSSVWALAGFLKERGAPVPTYDPAAWDWTAIEPAFSEWLDKSAVDLAIIFANASAVGDLQYVIMDSTMPRRALARLINAIQSRIDALPIEIFEPPLVLIGRSGPQAPAIGAAHQLLHNSFFAF